MVVVRGCGTRVHGGVYACTPLSKYGQPVEYFLIDPTVPVNPAGARQDQSDAAVPAPSPDEERLRIWPHPWKRKGGLK